MGRGPFALGNPLSQSARCLADSAARHPLTRFRARYTAEGLQQLLSVIAEGHNVTPADFDRLARPVTHELRAARQSLANAIDNVDIQLKLLDAIS